MEEEALQYILTYIKDRFQHLHNNIKLGREHLERYYHENNDEEGESRGSIYTPETTYERIHSNVTEMEDEKLVITKLIQELELITIQKALPTLPLLLKISSFLHSTIKRQQQQYDHDIEQYIRLEEYLKHIEHKIKPHLPTIFQLDIPYILIKADYDNKTSIYVQIYDYVLNSLHILQTQMRMYNKCIILYETDNPDASYQELMRWKEPYVDLYEKREDINDMILYFQHVFNKIPNPTSQDMMRHPDDPAESFFQKLSTFLNKKSDQLKREQQDRKFKHCKNN